MQDRSPSPHDVASQIDSLLRQFGALDYFRERVREAAQEHIEAVKEAEHRAKLRRDAVAKNGVLSLPLDAANEGYFDWSEEFRGRIKLLPDVTEPLMRLTDRPEFPNRPEFPDRPMKPRCLSVPIPRGNWSKEDERKAKKFNKKLADWEDAVKEYHKKRADWEKKKSDYVTAPKGGPSKWEEDWRPICELAKKGSFPDDGDGGLPYVFRVEAWLSADLNPDRDGPTNPLPVPETEISLNFKYAGLAAIYDAHWAGSKRIAPWGVVTCGGKVSPASGLPSEWKTPEEPGSYQAASWYCLLVMSAKELDDRNTTIVASWVAGVEENLAASMASRGQPDETRWFFETAPPADGFYRDFSIDGQLQLLAQCAKTTEPTVRKHNGTRWWVKREVRDRWRMWFPTQAEYAAARHIFLKRISHESRNES
jgi:hypothetical protein